MGVGERGNSCLKVIRQSLRFHWLPSMQVLHRNMLIYITPLQSDEAIITELEQPEEDAVLVPQGTTPPLPPEQPASPTTSPRFTDSYWLEYLLGADWNHPAGPGGSTQVPSEGGTNQLTLDGHGGRAIGGSEFGRGGGQVVSEASGFSGSDWSVDMLGRDRRVGVNAPAETAVSTAAGASSPGPSQWPQHGSFRAPRPPLNRQARKMSASTPCLLFLDIGVVIGDGEEGSSGAFDAEGGGGGGGGGGGLGGPLCAKATAAIVETMLPAVVPTAVNVNAHVQSVAQRSGTSSDTAAASCPPAAKQQHLCHRPRARLSILQACLGCFRPAASTGKEAMMICA